MTTALPDTSESPMVRMGRISFINVDPIYYGLEYGQLSGNLQIISAPPAELNRMMADGMLDVSSVSSAAYGLRHKEWLLLPGLSIACTGDVMSVLLVSRVPLALLQGRRILATDESATAVRLMKLMFYYKNITPLFETRKIHAPSQVDSDAMAALVIGDSALRHDWRNEFEFVWDLGDLWARHAKLPFVFAVWAVRKQFAAAHPFRVSQMIALLHESTRLGLANLDAVVKSASERLNLDPGLARKYFENFCYGFGEPEKSGLSAFFKDLHSMGIYQEPALIRFFE